MVDLKELLSGKPKQQDAAPAPVSAQEPALPQGPHPADIGPEVLAEVMREAALHERLTAKYPTDGQAAPGTKHDGQKRRYSLLPWGALGIVVDVLEHGAKKYATWNWFKVEDAEARYNEAILRHTVHFQEGFILDPDSKLPVLGHLACDALFLMAFHLKRGLYDAR